MMTVRVRGDKELAEALWKAANRYQNKAAVRKVTRPGAVYLRDGMRKVAQRTAFKDSTGNLAKSPRTFSWSRSWHYFVGPKVGGGKRGSRKRGGPVDGYYWGWIDFGTSKTGYGGGIKGRGLILRTLQQYGNTSAAIGARALLRDLDGFL